MQSQTYGEVSISEIAKIIKTYVEEKPEFPYSIVIGTDSQNFDKTKIVLVIAVVRESKGGIFFYEVSRINRITNIKQKLYKETELSLNCASELIEEFEKLKSETGFDYNKLGFGIHVDAGYNGKTREVIPEIVGWVKSCGYDVTIKPDSFAASSIADKYSK